MNKYHAVVYYMRDNHTFRELDVNNINSSLEMIAEEYADGYQYGLLCSKHPCAPHAIDANGDMEIFKIEARRWFEKFCDHLSKQYTTGEHGSDIIEKKYMIERGAMFQVDNPDIRQDESNIMRCPACGYAQQDAEEHFDHHLCSNPNPPWRKYFRSQAVPTMMYWVEYADGKVSDITPDKIPDGAVVTDVTFESDKREVRKRGRTFVDA